MAESYAKPPQPGKHMPGLDVLRGSAILSVLFYHGIYTQALWHRSSLGSALYSWMAAITQFGYLGVNLFFVLSGFLITGILLDTRADKDYYKAFYLRRVVRIVPAYLLMIFVLKVLRRISWAFVLISLLYLCNMGHSFQAQNYSPFWSLSVEEQFYLVWPFVILKLKPRYSLFVSLAVIVSTPILRFGLLHLSHRFADIDYKTWSIADFFAGGAAMSLCVRSKRLRQYLWRICFCLVIAGLLGFLFVWAPSTAAVSSSTARAFYYSPWVLFFSGIVLVAFLRPTLASSFPGRFLVFMGYISYSLYLCHSLVMNLFEERWTLDGLTGNKLACYIVLRFVIECLSAVAVAWLSRATFEAFFLRMKPRQRGTTRELSVI